MDNMELIRRLGKLHPANLDALIIGFPEAIPYVSGNAPADKAVELVRWAVSKGRVDDIVGAQARVEGDGDGDAPLSGADEGTDSRTRKRVRSGEAEEIVSSVNLNRQVAEDLVRQFTSGGRAVAVDYADCVFFEPINWLYPERAVDGAWCEETFALELFFKGPGGERGGALFAAVADDPDLTRALDRIALLSLRRAVRERLLGEYPELTFSMNVAAVTLADEEWLGSFTDEFVRELRAGGADGRVVLEIQEHPAALRAAMRLDEHAMSRRLELMRFCPLPLAIDDAYSEGYVFQAVTDSLDGRIAWQKMDWKYFRDRAADARDGLRSGIRQGLRLEVPILVIEGVENETLKGFLCDDVLDRGRIAPRVAIQSRTTQLMATSGSAATRATGAGPL